MGGASVDFHGIVLLIRTAGLVPLNLGLVPRVVAYVAGLFMDRAYRLEDFATNNLTDTRPEGRLRRHGINCLLSRRHLREFGRGASFRFKVNGDANLESLLRENFVRRRINVSLQVATYYLFRVIKRTISEKLRQGEERLRGK